MRTLLCGCVLLLTIVGARPAAAGTIVQFDTNYGTFDVELSADPAVATTVANFLAYVDAGRYTNTIIHRSTTYNPADIQILQGGGFVLNGNQLNPVATFAPIPLQAGATNLRGTIAMARTSDPNSATSGWFFNLVHNVPLDNGYAVFGSVIDTPLNPGLSVLDAIAGLSVYDASTQLGAAFSELPLAGSNLVPSNLVMVNGVVAVPEPSTLALAAAGGIIAVAAARRRRTAR